MNDFTSNKLFSYVQKHILKSLYAILIKYHQTFSVADKNPISQPLELFKLSSEILKEKKGFLLHSYAFFLN